MGNHADAQAKGQAPGILSPGDGAYWLWYIQIDPLVREVIGVYDHPPPAGTSPPLKAKQLGNNGALAAAEKLTRARDWTTDRIDSAVDWLW